MLFNVRHPKINANSMGNCITSSREARVSQLPNHRFNYNFIYCLLNSLSMDLMKCDAWSSKIRDHSNRMNFGWLWHQYTSFHSKLSQVVKLWIFQHIWWKDNTSESTAMFIRWGCFCTSCSYLQFLQPNRASQINKFSIRNRIFAFPTSWQQPTGEIANNSMGGGVKWM